MMLLSIILAAASLHCDKPDMFFRDETPGHFLSNPVPSENVYDVSNAVGKIIRVTTNTAAFYSSAVNAYLERVLFIGDDHGRPFTVDSEESWQYFAPSTSAEWYGTLKSEPFDNGTRLNVQGAVTTLAVSNRVVSNAVRFIEGKQTKRLCDAFRSLCFDENPKAPVEGGKITFNPCYPTCLKKFGGRDFPTFSFSKGTDFGSTFSPGELAKTWMNWRCLDDDGVFITNRQARTSSYLYPALSEAILALRVNTNEYEYCPTNVPNRLYVSGLPTPTQVIGKYAGPDNVLALTNDTDRLSYRRLCALGWLYGLSDRSIINSEYSFRKVNYSNADGYYVDLNYDVETCYRVTDLSKISMVRSYHDVHGWIFKLNINQSAFNMTSQRVTVITNSTDNFISAYGGQMYRMEASGRSISTLCEGSIHLKATMSADEMMSNLLTGVITHVTGEYSLRDNKITLTLSDFMARTYPRIELTPWPDSAVISTIMNCGANVRYTNSPFDFKDHPDVHPKLEVGYGAWYDACGLVDEDATQIHCVGNIVQRDKYFHSQPGYTCVYSRNREGDDVWYDSRSTASGFSTAIDRIAQTANDYRNTVKSKFRSCTEASADDPRDFCGATREDAAESFVTNIIWRVSINPLESLYLDYTTYCITNGSIIGDSGDTSMRLWGWNDGSPAIVTNVNCTVTLTPITLSEIVKTKAPCTVAGGFDYFFLPVWKYRNMRKEGQ